MNPVLIGTTAGATIVLVSYLIGCIMAWLTTNR